MKQYKILSSYCEAFKSDDELNKAIAEYLEIRKQDRFDAMDYMAQYRKQMNREGKIDLQEILEAEADKLGI